MGKLQHEARHEVQFLTLHGHRRAYVKAGQGPALLLLHGLGCDHTTWEPVIDALARRYTVIAPDLLGHGVSDKPRADYSVGGYANGMRDLLTVLGIDKVTVVGHSFGGGVAMQFAYQFPERTERLILVASGGLGPEVSSGDPRGHHPRLPPGDGAADAPGHPAPRQGRADRALAHRPQGRPRPRRGGRDLRLVPRPGVPRRDPARGQRGGRLEGPDRHHGRPRLPHRRDADGGDLGPRRPGDPGPARQQRRRPGAARPGRGDPRRRPLPAQGPPAAVRQDRARVHPLDPAGVVLARPVPPAAQDRPDRAGQPGRLGRQAPRRQR